METFDGTQFVATEVRRRVQLTDRIVLLELADKEDWRLPPFGAGAHVDVNLPSGTLRQYSLCSDPAVQNRYQIAVQREDAGRGGSREIAALQEGDDVYLSLPRNLFPLRVEAHNSVMFAGGIGLTPMMSMLPVLEREGRPFTLYVCTRSLSDTPFAEELLRPRAVGRIVLHHTEGDATNRLDMARVVSEQPEGTHFYACGPAQFLTSFKSATAHLPAESVHFEHFAIEKDPFQPAYNLRLAKTGVTVEVGKGETIVEAAARGGVKILTGCMAGICGACRVTFLSGEVIHRDMKLNSTERQSAVLACVGGCASKELVLDL